MHNSPGGYTLGFSFDMGRFTTVMATRSRECGEWPANAVRADIESIFGHVTIYTDESVQRSLKSGWTFSATTNGKVVQVESCLFRVDHNQYQPRNESHYPRLLWLQDQPFTYAVVATDSMSIQEQIKCQ